MSTFFKLNRKDYEAEVVSQTMKFAVAQRKVTQRKMARRFYSWLKERVNQSIARVDIIMSNLHNVTSALLKSKKYCVPVPEAASSNSTFQQTTPVKSSVL